MRKPKKNEVKKRPTTYMPMHRLKTCTYLFIYEAQQWCKCDNNVISPMVLLHAKVKEQCMNLLHVQRVYSSFIHH